MAQPTRLFIATPCYGDQVHLGYMLSLMQTVQLLREKEMAYELAFTPGDSLVTRARNTLVAQFLSNPDNSHLLFIDADLIWNPADVLALASRDKDLVGGIYPKKQYHWERLGEAQAMLALKGRGTPVTDLDFVKHNLVEYNLNLLPGEVARDGDCVQVRHVPTGFMMVRRAVFERLAELHPESRHVDDCGFLDEAQSEYLYAFFDCAVVDGHYLSEDWLFCHRCAQAGIDIWADLSIELRHTGTVQFEGRIKSRLHYLSRLQAALKARTAASAAPRDADADEE